MRRNSVNLIEVMFEWLKPSPVWTGDHKNLLLSEENNTEDIPNVSLSEIIEKSSQFPIKFPIDTIRCCQLKNHTEVKTLEKNINSAYPVIHENALYLCSTFLLHQEKYGEKKDFYKGMTLLQFIDRLLSKRAVVFMGAVDYYVLLDNRSGTGKWETIGTTSESPPLVLENCLSYDEIKLSALLSVSSLSYFINDGDRNNCGHFEENRGKVEENGVIIGLIGPRLEKSRVMEYREIVISEGQNTSCYGYGPSDVPTLQQEFLKFYGGLSETYDQILGQIKSNPERFFEFRKNKYFDRLMYQKRLALSIDTLLIEANDRAKQEHKKAYVHVVGLGLGVWKIANQQNKLFMDTFAQRLELLELEHISDVRFAYIHETSAGKYSNGDKVKGITLHMSDKNPQEKLVGEDEGKLLVVSYPWDGNALPGNEFWTGSLNGSGDPAAACSTQVAELHNWHINPKASARNLRVATFKGLYTFKEYQEMHKND
ncbi:uncharacterized protein LOC123008761 [Tribolium madens]|uniref:uncharacterized protein LOC123008761 n=1 Tax=Tribolium madens TaxID=41895 RepID=UPI001CF72D6E|nr:uncharacterized protein LOC123008761 [Tribolium madens]